MLSIDEIKALIKALDESSVDEMVYEADNQKLKLKKHTAPAYKQDTVQYLPQAVIEPIQSNQ
ncbi:MAG: acetyl-CoA carboxylase biotin carboxyl carrier protein, partial [Amphibacillus sp.]|nr:acetyl-CoA carboxylase biotin carboxyl carrier protein [Amphibacillus sp.]